LAIVTGTSTTTEVARGVSLVGAFASLVRFQHTVFALPFALAGALMAHQSWPPLSTLGWILLAMVGARSLAMALNRVIDAEIDAKNPRTAGRDLPSGRLTNTQVAVFCAISLAALLIAVSQLPRLTWFLWPIPVAGFVIYPYTKRFTWLCHLVLGVVIGLAPLGAWIAVTGHFAAAPVFLFLAVATWMFGFDVIYALMDVDFDRQHGIKSVPARFGAVKALRVTRVMHTLAVICLVVAGALAGSGPIYFVGVAVCAAVLVVENVVVDPADTVRIQAAFGTANGVLALVYIAFVILDVSVG
jgi:4-hydroxybenzoate polyprenyltransferase